MCIVRRPYVSNGSHNCITCRPSFYVGQQHCVFFLNIIWTYCTCMYYVSEINEYYYYYYYYMPIIVTMF